jgi:hypothetical protein
MRRLLGAWPGDILTRARGSRGGCTAGGDPGEWTRKEGDRPMKIEMFHLMPYRGLPEDFRERHHSVWVDVPNELCDPAVAHELYNQSLDELELAAELGFDGVCVNEHHQNAYGFMPSPNIMAAALARRP